MKLPRRRWGAQLRNTSLTLPYSMTARWFWTKYGAEDWIRRHNRGRTYIDGVYRLISR